MKRGSIQDFTSINDKNFENLDKSLFLKEIQVFHDVKGPSKNSSTA